MRTEPLERKLAAFTYKGGHWVGHHVAVCRSSIIDGPWSVGVLIPSAVLPPL